MGWEQMWSKSLDNDFLEENKGLSDLQSEVISDNQVSELKNNQESGDPFDKEKAKDVFTLLHKNLSGDLNSEDRPELASLYEELYDFITDQESYDDVKVELKRKYKNLKLGINEIASLRETPQSDKRNAMIEFQTWRRKRNSNEISESGEKMVRWLWKIQQLRLNWLIIDTAEWVRMEWIWMLASTAMHNKILEEKFSWKIQRVYKIKDAAWNISKINTVRLDDLEIYMLKNDNRLESGNFRLESKEFIENKILPWIDIYFWDEDKISTINKEVFKDELPWNKLSHTDKLYILQLINPDLFTIFWLNTMKPSWGSRCGLSLPRKKQQMCFGDNAHHNAISGLFLVWDN